MSMNDSNSSPEGWSTKTYDEVADISGGSTPKTDDDSYWGGKIEWVVPSEITDRVEVEYQNTERKITQAASSNILPAKSVLMTSRATVGVPVINDVPMATNQGFQNFDVSSSSEVTPYYLYYQLLQNASFIDSVASGGTFDEISNSELSKLRLTVPPLPEQERIASVLYSVDEHVRTLDDRYDTLTDHKQALMQDLFLGRTYIDGSVPVTDGVPGNGAKLNEQEFPDDWSIETLGNVCEVNAPVENESQKVDYLPMDSLSETVPWPQYTKTRNPQENSGTYFRESDTLIAKITPSTENGKSAFIEDIESKFGIASTEIISLTPTDVNPKFLYYYVNSHPAKGYAVSQMRGTSGRQRVPTTVFKKELKIPIPSRRKQERIASILYTVDEMIARTASLRDEYERLKQGLMQDLLSGDVRTPEAIETLSEVTKNPGGNRNVSTSSETV